MQVLIKIDAMILSASHAVDSTKNTDSHKLISSKQLKTEYGKSQKGGQYANQSKTVEDFL